MMRNQGHGGGLAGLGLGLLLLAGPVMAEDEASAYLDAPRRGVTRQAAAASQTAASAATAQPASGQSSTTGSAASQRAAGEAAAGTVRSSTRLTASEQQSVAAWAQTQSVDGMTYRHYDPWELPLDQQRQRRAADQRQRGGYDPQTAQAAAAVKQSAAPARTAPASTADAASRRQVVLLHGIEIVDASLPQSRRPQVDLQRYYERPVDYELLNAVLREIQRAYVAEGWVGVDVSYPPQDAQDGRLQVEVRHQTLESVEVSGGLSHTGRNILFDQLRSLQGQPLNIHELEEPLLRLGEIGTFDVAPSLEPGSDKHQAVLRAKVADKAPSYMLYMDNHGSKSSGRYRVSAMGMLHDVSGLGDRLYGGVSASNENMYSASLGYNVPLASWPLVWGISAAWSSYDLGYEYADLGATGEALDLATFLRAVFHKGSAVTWGGDVGLYYRDITDSFESYALDLEKHALGAYLSTDYRYAQTQWNVAGKTKLTAGRLYNDDNWGLYQDQTYYILSQELSAALRLGEGTALYYKGKAQLSSAPLNSYERISLTGAEAMSMYDSGQLSTDSGIFSQVGVQWTHKHEGMLYSVKPHVDWALGHYKGGSTYQIYGAALELGASWQGLFAQVSLGNAWRDIDVSVPRDNWQVLFTFGYQGQGKKSVTAMPEIPDRAPVPEQTQSRVDHLDSTPRGTATLSDDSELGRQFR